MPDITREGDERAVRERSPPTAATVGSVVERAKVRESRAYCRRALRSTLASRNLLGARGHHRHRSCCRQHPCLHRRSCRSICCCRVGRRVWLGHDCRCRRSCHRRWRRRPGDDAVFRQRPEALSEALKALMATHGFLPRVRVRTPDQEDAAKYILMGHGAQAVRVHEIEIVKRPDAIPLSCLRPDPWLGDERLGGS
jgi:hypothetical protein